VRVTEVVPVTVAPSAMPPLPAIKAAVGAVSAPVVVMLLPAVLAFNVNEEPLLAERETVAAESTIDTAPVEVALRVVALIGLAAVNVMPPVPEFRTVLAAVSVPPPVMPLATSVALRLKDVALVVLTVIAPVAVSVITTAPPEVACSVLAEVALIVAPPAPDVMIKEAVLSPIATLLEVTVPLAADRVMEPLAV
jgi:hypothetical protein